MKGTNDWRQQQRKAKEQNDGKMNIDDSKEIPISSTNKLTVVQQHQSAGGTRRKNARSKSVPSMPLNFRPDLSNPNHLTPSEHVRKRSVDVSNGGQKRSMDVSNGGRKRSVDVSNGGGASCRCARERRVSTSSCGTNCNVIY